MSTRRRSSKSLQDYQAKLRRVAEKHPLPISETIAEIDVMNVELVYLEGAFEPDQLQAILRHMKALGEPDA
jgi:hypothetical protein